MPRAKVCGVPVLLGKEHFSPHFPEMGRHAGIDKASATKLVKSLFGPTTRPPRAGYDVKLCDNQWLENSGGKFTVRRRGPGEFRGTAKRRRRR